MKAKTSPPARRETAARARVSDLARRSYVLSRLWSWCSRIEVTPKLRVPVPRLFTSRDP